MSAPPDKPKKLKKQPKLGFGSKRLPWLIVALLICFSLFMLNQYQQAQDKLQATTPAATTHRVNDVVSKVSKLILLPKNETPNIVTVKDASKLKGEQFYADAKNGDITLVYTKQRRAILYRPSQDIIVNVAAVSVAPRTTNP